MNKIEILKFGGAALFHKIALENMIRIINGKSQNKLICIISAIGKTTSMLNLAANYAYKGNTDKADELINHIIDYHIEYLNYFKNNINNYKEILNLIKKLKIHIKDMINGIFITSEISPKTYDKFLSKGEDLALILIGGIIKNTIKFIETVDSKNIITTDSNYGNAKPDYKLTFDKIQNNLIPLIDKYQTLIIPGFKAVDNENNITTMGIESSNLTAIILAKFFKAKNISIYTNVNGIRNADPNLFDNTKLIDHLDYSQAKLTAKFGLKLTYYEMIKLAESNKINITYSSLIETNDYKTIINSTKGKNEILIIKNNNFLIEKKEFNNDSNNQVIYSTEFKDSTYYLIDDFKLQNNKKYYSMITIIFVSKDKILKIIDTINLNKIFEIKIIKDGIIVITEEKYSKEISEKIYNKLFT